MEVLTGITVGREAVPRSEVRPYNHAVLQRQRDDSERLIRLDCPRCQSRYVESPLVSWNCFCNGSCGVVVTVPQCR